jgi:N-acetylmuramoyl-L-alanine amidase
MDSAERLVSAANGALPPRTDVVSLAYLLAAEATKAGNTEEGAERARLAAELRARAYRLDHVDADAKEAIELYRVAADAAPGTEIACSADRARAALVGEASASARSSYRELYLAERRQSAAMKSPDASACVRGIRSDLALVEAFRPGESEMAALAAEGDRASALAAPAVAPPASASSSAGSTPGIDVVVSSDPPKAHGPVKVTSIEHFGSEGGGRVVVDLSGPTSFHVGALAAEGSKDPRIFVDVDQASSKGIARQIEVGGAIRRVRTAPHGDGTRVVLDLAEDMHRRIFYLPEPFRIVVDVSSRPVEDAPPIKPGDPRPIKRVVIDPGHGGDDAGAIGPTGLREKDVTLDIAHRVAPILAHELGVETLLTRDTDVFVPLDERTARANAFHADLFVSIHCNASPDGEARGVESFVLDAAKEESRANARIAALENGLKLKSLDPVDMDAEMARVFNGLKSGRVGEESRVLGGLLERSVLASMAERYPDTKEHGVKSAAFYVLAGAEMPAVLFETSFISNTEDESRLATADYRQKLADAVANAIKAYREGQ